MIKKKCPYCGKHFETKTKRQKYCSLKCGEMYRGKNNKIKRREVKTSMSVWDNIAKLQLETGKSYGELVVSGKI